MADGPLLGRLLELEVGAAAHGGSCVARHGEPAGRVVFVRHTLPGERVRARVVEDRGGSFCRADAVEILRASPDRVRPPCPHAGPGRCGGCDWQHASGPAQRELKRAVVCEQFQRLAGVDVSGLLAEVAELPGGLLGWRTRVSYAVGADGRPGLHRHRSHQLEPVTSCPLGVPGVGDTPALRREWAGLNGVDAVCGDDGVVSLIAHRPGPRRPTRGRRPPEDVEVLEGPQRLRHRLGERDFTVDASGFWQVHPGALPAFVAALLDGLRPRPGEAVLDLYAGAAPLTAALAEAVGQTGRVLGVESSPTAVADAAANLAELAWARVEAGRVSAELIAGLDIAPDLAVLDPPRAGAGRDVMSALLRLRPRAIGYVACDPAALARDAAVALAGGWRLAGLRAFDAFPMTHHVECVAVLEPASTR